MSAYGLAVVIGKKRLCGRLGSVFAGQPTLIYSLSVAAFGTFN